tara:strand:- start:824 stop:1057 length:234 start_codon:yes stop_codon:yes gene_type:complete
MNVFTYKDKYKDTNMELWGRSDKSSMAVSLSQQKGKFIPENTYVQLSLDRESAIDLVSFMIAELKVSEDELLIRTIK